MTDLFNRGQAIFFKVSKATGPESDNLDILIGDFHWKFFFANLTARAELFLISKSYPIIR